MRAIIFDLDDTLYDNKDLRIAREKAILDFLGNKKWKYKELKENYSTLESLKRLGFEKSHFFRLMDKIPITLEKDPRLIKMFKKLKERFKMIVLSNVSAFCVEETLRRLGILEMVNEYYSGEDFKNQKPAKECFCIVKRGDICVGNNFKKDLEVPKQKGAITILVGEEEQNADFRIDNIYELESVLKYMELSNFQ